MKILRKLLLKSNRVRLAVADSLWRVKDQARKDHLVSVIFRGGSMRL